MGVMGGQVRPQLLPPARLFKGKARELHAAHLATCMQTCK